MTKVAFVHSVNVLGGAERMSEAIVQGLQHQAFEFALISPTEGSLSKTFARYGCENLFFDFVQPSFRQPLKTLKAKQQFKTLLKNSAIDILHTGDLICTRSIIKAASELKVPVICHIHFPLEEAFVAWVFKRFPKPAAFIFCSRELQQGTGALLKKYCPDTEQYLVHNGVDTDVFTPQPKAAVPIDGKVHIGIIANLQQRKGHDDFIAMAAEVVKTHQDVHFDIIGGDILQEPREPLLKQRVQDLGLSDYFTFHGQLSDVRAALHKLDIYVCASHLEAFPVSILEAMACQKAIVSTNVNGIPEMLEHQQNALLIEPHRPDQMAQAVLLLLDSKELADELSQKALSLVGSKFSLIRYCQSISAVYKAHAVI